MTLRAKLTQTLYVNGLLNLRSIYYMLSLVRRKLKKLLAFMHKGSERSALPFPKGESGPKPGAFHLPSDCANHSTMELSQSKHPAMFLSILKITL